MSSEPINLKGCRVLLVEDSWHAAQAMQDLLEGWGMIVVGPVASAGEAKQYIGSNTPPVAIVDIRLKDGLAYDLIDVLNDKGVSVIIASGYADVPALEGKVATILQKPFPARELLATLRSVMARRHQTR
ncbi:MAG: response regulator [Hyphomicrobium sp.]|nr:response regulator [Hyphomicrobium sp.]